MYCILNMLLYDCIYGIISLMAMVHGIYQHPSHGYCMLIAINCGVIYIWQRARRGTMPLLLLLSLAHLS